MKKTLLGALAFVLLLSTLLTGIVLTSSAAAAQANAHVGDIYAVSENQPIIVDGLLDKAYLESPALLINMRDDDIKGLYTQGVFRFAWSPSENAIYCHVIINDVDLSETVGDPWTSDSVELFLHRGDDNKKDFALGDENKWPTLSRGRQYRIDHSGAPSCAIYEEFGSYSTTYTWNETLGRLDGGKTNPAHQLMVSDTENYFGWYEGGWASSVFNDGGTLGYTVEFKIVYPEDAPLAAGEAFRFDVQVNDLFNNSHSQQIYYRSGARAADDSAAADANLLYYDYFTLSSTNAANDGYIANDQLGTYGRSDASTQTTGDLIATSWVSTVRSSYIRSVRTGTVAGQVNTNNTNTTTTAQAGNGGGCGGTIAAGSSVILLAMAGATGFFAFRRRRNGEDE